MTKLLTNLNPRRLFFVLAIIPVLAFNLPANAWLFGLMVPSGAYWLAWGAAVAFEASIVAIQTMLPNIERGSQERRAAWVGLVIVVGLSVLANIGHDVQFFSPAASKLAGWLDSIASGAAWAMPVTTGLVRPAILIVFSVVVARPLTVPASVPADVPSTEYRVPSEPAEGEVGNMGSYSPTLPVTPHIALADEEQPQRTLVQATVQPAHTEQAGGRTVQQLAEIAQLERSTVQRRLAQLAKSGKAHNMGGRPAQWQVDDAHLKGVQL